MSREVQPDHGGQTTATFREAALPVAAAGPKVFIGIKTAPGNAPRRTAWRESQCGKGLLAAGLQYAFVVGEPLDPGQDLAIHAQGKLATEHERKLEEELLQEGAQFKDILAIPETDAYERKSDKILEIYRHGYSQIGAEYIMETDDDYCVQPKALLASIAEHEAGHASTELYAGAYLFNGLEYTVMKGPRGEVAPFFTGHGAVVSRGLVKLIIEDDAMHSVLNGIYGTSSDDANVGKWVEYAKATHGIKVNMKTIPGLLSKELSK